MRRFATYLALITMTLASLSASAMTHTASSTSCLPSNGGVPPQQIVNEATRRARSVAMETARSTLEIKCGEGWRDLEIISHSSQCDTARLHANTVCVKCTATAKGKC